MGDHHTPATGIPAEASGLWWEGWGLGPENRRDPGGGAGLGLRGPVWVEPLTT